MHEECSLPNKRRMYGTLIIAELGHMVESSMASSAIALITLEDYSCSLEHYIRDVLGEHIMYLLLDDSEQAKHQAFGATHGAAFGALRPYTIGLSMSFS